MSSLSETPRGVDPAALRRKVWLRTIPLIFLAYIVAYLDRANAGFAKLDMAKSLGPDLFTAQVFGWGFGIFFAGYLLLEIPGALLVEHWSARKWFARILVTWGICSMATALVTTPQQFYLARFMLGLAEAGFFPGVIVYMTHWFPRAERGRAMAGLVLGIPVSLAGGALLSHWLLQQSWFGLGGWQWVFIAEGFPAVVLGFAVFFLLTDRPRDATWLTPEERDYLESTLEKERAEVASVGGMTLGEALHRPTVWILALGIMAVNTGGYAMVFWLPTAVSNLLAMAGEPSDDPAVMRWLSVIYLCGLGGVLLAGYLSDRIGRHKWICVAGVVMTGTFLALSGTPGLTWGATFAVLCLMGFFAFSWPTPFWVLPTLTLTASAAAVSIGFINIFANVAGLIGSPVVGQMKAAGFDERACLLFLAGCYVAGGVIIATLRVPPARSDDLVDGPGVAR